MGIRKNHELISPALPFQLWVVADGFRTAELANVRGDREVVMHPGLPVRIVVSNYPPELSGKKYLGVEMKFLESPFGRNPTRRGDTDENGEALILAPDPGEYEVTFQFKKTLGIDTNVVQFYGVWSGDPVWDFQPTVTVSDATEEQVFRIELPESAIENVVAQAKD